MMAKLRAGIIFGGRSGEHEVSLMSARSVIAALDPDKYEVFPIGITLDGSWLSGSDPEQVLQALQERQTTGLFPVALLAEPGSNNLYRLDRKEKLEVLSGLDVIFPVLHGTFGEDGTIQGLFEMASVPYVGAGVLAASVAMDKGVFKALMRAEKIPVLDDVVLLSSRILADVEKAAEIVERIGAYPFFTKPANMGSSVGVSKCRGRADLIEGLMDAARYDRRVVVEIGLDAREIEISILGNDDPQASEPGEIVPCDDFYSYRAKYVDDDSDLIIPAQISAEMSAEARRMAIAAFKAIDGAGLARVDFLLDRISGKLYLNEINTMPGFTSISMYPKLWEHSGISFRELMDRLIELAMARHGQKAGLERTFEEAK